MDGANGRIAQDNCPPAIRLLGGDAYGEARWREQTASSSAMAQEWNLIALAIARQTGRRIGLDVSTRMAMNAVFAPDRELAERKPRPNSELAPLDELKRIFAAKQQPFRIQFVGAAPDLGLAGGRLPSGLFGANAAWWAIMVLAHNLNALMKHRVLGGDWAARRMKAMRFHLIALPGRVVRHARRLIVRLSAGALDLIRDVRAAILSLQPAPSG